MTEPSVVAVFPHARVTSLQNSASDLGCPLAADGSRAGIQLPEHAEIPKSYVYASYGPSGPYGSRVPV